jgi:hypothetical protein
MDDELNSVAFSGNYEDLNNQPSIPEAGGYVTKGKQSGFNLGNSATAEGYSVRSLGR